MKIDGNYLTPNADLSADASAKTDGARKVADRQVAKTGDRSGPGGADKVELSSDAQLMAAALKATADAASVRTDVVEAMKQKLAAGEIGNDSGRLADRLIDDLLKR